MIRLCTLKDHDPWFRADSTGHNKVGYVTMKDTVIYPVRRHVKEIPLLNVAGRLDLKKFQLLKYNCPLEYETLIERFFTENVLNPALIRLGFHQLTNNAFDFFTEPVRLPKLHPISKKEHDERWDQMLLQIREGDLVFIFDSSRAISTLIAKVDMGTWSHVAAYTGDGKIIEAITSGVTKRNLAEYSGSQYRIGVYRHISVTPEKIAAMSIRAHSFLGRHYDWPGVLLLSIRKLLRVRLKHKLVGNASPNDLIVNWGMKLVSLV